MALKTFELFGKDMGRHSREVQRFLKADAPRIMGIEAKNHFKQSFVNGGFTDSSLVPWKPAKRTNPKSVWYGFEAGAKTPPPDNHPRRWKTKKSYKARRKNPITNYSPAATSRPTLTGKNAQLKNGIKYRTMAGRAIVYSNHPAADVLNEGGTIKVFGKKQVRIQARPFMQNSTKLNAQIKQRINKRMDALLK